MSHAIARYLPESMFITIGPELAPFAESDNPQGFQNPASFGYFFHEYAHYLHNISTVSGITVFINTLELLRCFRQTFDAAGLSNGSDFMKPAEKDHLRTLSAFLTRARLGYAPHLTNIISPVGIKITSLKNSADVTGPKGELLTVLVCDAEVSDQGGNTENCVARIGTLELLESAAWLLERRVVEAMDSNTQIDQPSVFPYRVIDAAARYAVPGLDDRGIIACVLAALQSSDAPEALEMMFGIAAEALRHSQDPMTVLRQKTVDSLNQGRAELDSAFTALDSEFGGSNILARSVRQIVATARRLFEERCTDPFFEFQIIEDMKTDTESFVNAIKRFAPCAVLQKRFGDDDDLERDILISFLPTNNEHGQDPENGLRVVHSIFHFLGRHRTQDGFVSSCKARRDQCPFYTCCNLPLRLKEPAICKAQPWKSVDWPEWDQEKGTCWYGTAVRITRPPDDVSAQTKSPVT